MPDSKKFTALTQLRLSNTLISDTGLGRLKALANLQVLNLAGTAVTGKGVSQLKALPHLRELYLFQTPAGMHDWSIRKAFPHATIDSGGYIVPTLTTDATVVKPKPLPKA